MVDKATTKQSPAVKGGASAADVAARPFQCEWHEGCPRSFDRKSDLQRHHRIHTNERPYACHYELCSKTFIQRSAMIVHSRSHTGEKPHKCPFAGCEKRFSDSSSLARHRRIHNNDKRHICKIQRCKKAFYRKTTLTTHIREKHPAEQDTEEGKEDPQHPYREPTDLDQRNQSVGAPSQYNRSLWRLPGETVHEIKLERSCSSTLQRSLTDPYPTGPMHSSDYSSIRADTMPDGLPQAPASAGVPTQYQLGNNDNMGIWSSRSLQDSPTSLTHSSPISASAHPLFASQSYQFQQVSIPESMSYPDHQQTVRNLEQLKFGQSQLHQYGGLQQNVSQQDAYTDTSREASQYQSYNGTQAQTVTQHYQSDMPPTPAPTQSMPQYTAPVQEVPYHAPQFLPPDNYPPIGNQHFSLHINGLYQYNDGTDGWKEEVKPEDWRGLLPFEARFLPVYSRNPSSTTMDGDTSSTLYRRAIDLGLPYGYYQRIQERF